MTAAIRLDQALQVIDLWDQASTFTFRTRQLDAMVRQSVPRVSQLLQAHNMRSMSSHHLYHLEVMYAWVCCVLYRSSGRWSVTLFLHLRVCLNFLILISVYISLPPGNHLSPIISLRVSCSPPSHFPAFHRSTSLHSARTSSVYETSPCRRVHFSCKLSCSSLVARNVTAQ